MEIQELKLNIIKKKENQRNSGLKSKSHLYENINEGDKYGKWTVKNNVNFRGSSVYVLCQCDCKLERWILFYDLLRGKSNQCKSCATIKRNLKHGQNQQGQISYEYKYWQGLKIRKSLDPLWEKSFEIFFKDVGKRPDERFILLKKNSQYKHSTSNSYWGNRRLKYFKDIKGKIFGQWTVLEEDLEDKRLRWLCQCSCGIKDHIQQNYLIKGSSTKCKSCAMPKINTTHNKSKSREYHIYYTMKDRCLNIKNKNYPDYGGRGIKICDRWLESFENFYDDMGNSPSQKYSLERIDNEGNYSKENCKWATQKEQCNNRRTVQSMQIQVNDLEDKIKKLQDELAKYKI